MSISYDPLETVRWMITETTEQIGSDRTLDAAGRRRPKSRAQREREEQRLRTLCEVVWNAEGRREPLEVIVGRFSPVG